MLETGRYATIDELAKAEKINASYVSRILRLTLVAPEIVEAILDGRAAGGDDVAGVDGAVPGGVDSTERRFVKRRIHHTPLHGFGLTLPTHNAQGYLVYTVVRSPAVAATRLLAVINALRPADNGGAFDHHTH